MTEFGFPTSSDKCFESLAIFISRTIRDFVRHMDGIHEHLLNLKPFKV